MDLRPGMKASARYLPDPPAAGWNVPLIRNGEIIERPADQTTLTKRYTEEAVKFIAANQTKPFFLYLAHTMPHTPLFASPPFTSDNGPWLSEREQGGSAGLLKDGKGSTGEGGMRVPAIAWMPGRIQSGVTSEPASTLDWFPTALALAGVKLPPDSTLDGEDIGPLLFERKPLPKRPFFYYRGEEIFACRFGDWKMHHVTQGGFGGPGRTAHDPPLLFHLSRDPSEQFNVASNHPAVLAEIRAAVERHRAGVVPAAPNSKP